MLKTFAIKDRKFRDSFHLGKNQGKHEVDDTDLEGEKVDEQKSRIRISNISAAIG
jgi:hypothetical protein